MAEKKRPGVTFAMWQKGLTPRAKRVEEVLDLMCSGRWLGGVTDKVLAEKWDCSPANVRQIAAEANRVLKARMRDDPEAQKEARAQILQTFEVIRARAMRDGTPAALRVALDATRAQGFYLGVEPAKQLDVTQRRDEFEGWSVEEKLAFSREGRRPRRAMRTVASELNGNGQDTDDGDNVH